MKKIKFFVSLLIIPLTILLFTICTPPRGGASSSGGGEGSDDGDDPPPTAQYTLTIQIIGNGSVTPGAGTHAYNAGTEVTLQATPGAGYEFIQWQEDLTGNNPSSKIIMCTDRIVRAYFVNPDTINIFTLTTSIINTPPDGIIQKTPAPINGIDEYYEGTEVTLQAIADSGNTLKEWTGDSSGFINPIVISMDENKTIKAEFKELYWTILIHFAIDNNIDYNFEKNYGLMTNYLETLEDIKDADDNNDIEILVLMDCYNNDTTFIDGYYRLTGGDFNGDLVTYKTEINSGDVDDTKDFMDWVVNNYSGTNYMYSVFNHGSGFDDQNIEGTYSTLGIGFDDSHNDCLSHNEVGQTTAYLKGLIGKNIELFYAYACLMGGVELAYEIKDNANYLLFSEELFPAEKWSYEALDSIINNPATITGAEIGKAFCDSAYIYFPTEGRNFTLSVIDLSNIDTLVNEINNYASDAITDIETNDNRSVYNTAVDNSLTFLKTYYDNDYYYVDLGDYLTNINSDTSINVTAVTNALNNCVTYKTYNGSTYQDASGLSIFHNIIGSRYFYDPSLYESILEFGTDINNWTEYVKKFTIEPDIYEYDNQLSNAKLITINNLQSRTCHSISNSYDYDFIKVNLQSGTTYKIETYQTANTANIDTWIEIYNSSGTHLDEDDDSGTDFYSLLNFTCPSTGTYYIYVDCWFGSGNYDIDVTTVPSGLSRDNIKKNIETRRMRATTKKRFKKIK